VMVDIELKEQVKHAPDINKGTMTSMQQVECLELALELTKGNELATVLWKKSRPIIFGILRVLTAILGTSAASWLERRTAYARSLATNSMVGHLLGLGDRHPSNLLQDRITVRPIARRLVLELT
jgi:FKBP12-rapamycin complex-associated protein